tara:strand:- start:13989 stop:14393 length:405 start_codon:yes stop_codon:yes gene_type:complete
MSMEENLQDNCTAIKSSTMTTQMYVDLFEKIYQEKMLEKRSQSRNEFNQKYAVLGATTTVVMPIFGLSYASMWYNAGKEAQHNFRLQRPVFFKEIFPEINEQSEEAYQIIVNNLKRDLDNESKSIIKKISSYHN